MAKLGEYGHKLPTMTAQEVFDVAAKHLLEQNRRSSGALMERCLYDGGQDLCCAAAPFIADYDKSYEGKAWRKICHKDNESDNHEALIAGLQSIHDTYPPVRWMEELKFLASRHKLSSDIIEEVLR